MKDKITLAHGSGGKEMDELISKFSFPKGNWTNHDDDSAVMRFGDKNLVFTTDSFTVDPLFFPGADIGHLAFSGTVNDLCVMGARPLGLSLSFIIEEGFKRKDLDRIVSSIRQLSEEYDVPVVTGDTKVMSRGKIDGIVINVSGTGIADEILDGQPEEGEKIILSGGLGEHAVSLLSKRFDYETDLVSDSKPMIDELLAVKDMIKIAKDPTRGGVAAVLNELSDKKNIAVHIDEGKIPAKREVRTVVDMLGINLYELACEGRFVCVAEKGKEEQVLKKLKGFNEDAAIIGEVKEGDKVHINTELGSRILPKPTGRIVPRIC
ncbi:MAG: hydrogenase expression/formation protein HypE [Nanobdellota archaeon]